MAKHAPRTPREADNLFRPIAVEVRQNGTSHRVYKFADGGMLTVSQHVGEFGPKTRRQIYRLAVFYGLLALVILALVVRVIA